MVNAPPLICWVSILTTAPQGLQSIKNFVSGDGLEIVDQVTVNLKSHCQLKQTLIKNTATVQNSFILLLYHINKGQYFLPNNKLKTILFM